MVNRVESWESDKFLTLWRIACYQWGWQFPVQYIEDFFFPKTDMKLVVQVMIHSVPKAWTLYIYSKKNEGNYYLFPFWSNKYANYCKKKNTLQFRHLKLLNLRLHPGVVRSVWRRLLLQYIKLLSVLLTQPEEPNAANAD